MTLRDPISPDLTAVLRRLKLGRMLDTLPDRLILARQQKNPPRQRGGGSPRPQGPAAPASASRATGSRT